jgi:HlyD family secretion protein
MRRDAVTVGLIVVCAACFTACAAARQPQTELGLRRGTVQRGSIDEVVSATGAVLPEERVSLSFGEPGVVVAVFVEVGEFVPAGAPLVTTDRELLELSLKQAELGLEAQQLEYDRLFAPPSQADVAAAKADLESAQAAYEQQKEGADPEAIRIAQWQYEQAFSAYIQADINLRAVQGILCESDLIPLREQVDQALLNVELARLQLEQARAGPDQHVLDAAWASVVEAQARLSRQLEGPTDLEVTQAEIQIEQSLVVLDRARQRLELTTLIAPFSGTVSEVNASPGMLPPGSEPAVVLIDISHLHVEVEVDEMDIGDVMPGQPVLLMLDALPGERVEGQVTSISPSATVDQGVVTYNARIDFDPGDLPLRPGMTVTADIIIQRLENVLLVPNWAVRFDRASGQAFVNILTEAETLQEIPVALGLRGSAFSQVIAGLEEGQTVAIDLAREEISIFEEEE